MIRYWLSFLVLFTLALPVLAAIKLTIEVDGGDPTEVSGMEIPGATVNTETNRLVLTDVSCDGLASDDPGGLAMNLNDGTAVVDDSQTSPITFERNAGDTLITVQSVSSTSQSVSVTCEVTDVTDVILKSGFEDDAPQ